MAYIQEGRRNTSGEELAPEEVPAATVGWLSSAGAAL
jgi:hypothetical protein